MNIIVLFISPYPLSVNLQRKIMASFNRMICCVALSVSSASDMPSDEANPKGLLYISHLAFDWVRATSATCTSESCWLSSYVTDLTVVVPSFAVPCYVSNYSRHSTYANIKAFNSNRAYNPHSLQGLIFNKRMRIADRIVLKRICLV